MKRIQLFEFEDFNWFPAWMRAAMTNLIVVLHKILGTKEAVISTLNIAQEKHPFHRIVDMGSGSGGIMPIAVEALNSERKGEEISLLLTDLHPNQSYIQQIEEQNIPNLSYSSTSLDATNLATAPEGLKTMSNSFHHMPPKQAKAILKSAQDNRQALVIYEIAENKIPLLAWWIFLPISLAIVFIMALVMTPFCKNLTLKQLIFTYLIPIIPLAYAWDGQASLPRMYTFDDIKNYLLPEKVEGYEWSMAPALKKDGKSVGYYVIGTPISE